MSRVRVFLSLVVVVAVGGTAPAQGYNEGIVAFCKAHLGKRVGSGECSHLTTEALRVVGAEFTSVDAKGKRIPNSPESGDYVWGELIYKKEIKGGVESVDGVAGKRVKPGDIIQYGGAVLASGLVISHHTAVVAVVDGKGTPTQLYEQNTGALVGKAGGREVKKGPAHNLRGMKAGRVMIYRPGKATNPATLQFTLTNNATRDTVTYEFFDRPLTIGGQNTAGGFRALWGGGSNTTKLKVDGATFTVQTRKGYEFYRKADGKIGLREVK